MPFWPILDYGIMQFLCFRLHEVMSMPFSHSAWWRVRLFRSATFLRPRITRPRNCRPTLEHLETRTLFSIFAAEAVFPVGGSGPRDVAVGDFNGDGKQDLATANNFS